MKIAMLAPHDLIPIYYGTPRRLCELASFLSRFNDVNVYYPDFPRKVIGEIPGELKFNRIPVKCFMNHLYPLMPSFSFFKGLYDLQLWLYFPLRRLLESFQPDVIDVQSPWLFPLAYKLGKDVGSPVVLTEYDVGFIVYSELGYRTAFLLRSLEIFALKNANAVVALTEKDRKELSKYIDSQKLFVIPDGVDVDYFHPKLGNHDQAIKEKYGAHGPLLVFHGYLSYPPNKEAVEIIEEKIINKIIEKEPKTKVMIVGRNPPNTSHPNIITTGFVEDLARYICAADIAIVPLTSGGGIKEKILDYLSCGIPVVTTEKGAEGIGLTHGKDVLISKDVDDNFVDLVCRLLNDRTLRDRLARSGRRFVEEKHRWKDLMFRYYEIYERVLERRLHS